MQACYKLFRKPASAQRTFAPFSGKPYAFLLESGRRHRLRGRFSFFSASPFAVLRYEGGRVTVESEGQKKQTGRSLQETLRALMKEYVLPQEERLSYPFLCGAVGFLAYDFGFSLEEVRRRHRPQAGIPDLMFGFYDCAVAFDHFKKEMVVFSSGFPQHGRGRKKRARRRLGEVLQVLEERAGHEMSLPVGSEPAWRSDVTQREYETAVRKAKAYIAAGDIYQVNLSQRFRGRTRLEDRQIYDRLARAFPAGFSAYFRGKDFSIISASPEQFLMFDGQTVATRPMKGTRPRSGRAGEDARQRQQLWKSRKEKAELLMVVDLERNDLGRVCDYGSVRLREKRTLEAYRTVFQATSEIAGRLHPGKDRWDLLKACFPGGSVTGCPKIRAMEIIEELEPVGRGIYTGALGYLSFHDTLQFNILIRTLLKIKDRVSFYVGGGIVADSDPRREYEETLVKARALFEAFKDV
ncbi:MAG: anthranilate synthase component I family protein [Candidatus Omnitrophica bacterium]|nr:anthranilate synthase component I family protein [Candidatus Omnitrophota bacterium]